MFFSPASNIIIATVGGILPALVWLWFWLREDKLHPEPRQRVILCFLTGMAAVLLVWPLQKYFTGIISITIVGLFLVWAIIEEAAKYLAAWISSLRTKDFDEPIDALIYMITAALGFSAIENTFFIMTPLLNGDLLGSIATGNTRFIGASLLHVAGSAIIGYTIAITYNSSLKRKLAWRSAGFIAAVILHTLFNVFIIRSNGEKTLLVFSLVWVIVFVILFLFETIKKASKRP